MRLTGLSAAWRRSSSPLSAAWRRSSSPLSAAWRRSSSPLSAAWRRSSSPLSAAWRRSSSPLSASLKPDLPGIGRRSGPPPPLQSSPCGHTCYSLTHRLTVCGIILVVRTVVWATWNDDISICVRYETFLNVVLDTKTICGMRRTVRTDGRTDKT